MKIKAKAVLISAIAVATLVAGFGPVSAGADGNSSNGRITVYFTRHAEKETITADRDDVVANAYSSDSEGFFVLAEGVTIGGAQDEVCGDSKCAEQLNAFGEVRAGLLAEWFDGKGVTEKLDAVYATHKIRTQQTVQPTADLADLALVTLPALNEDGEPATELNPQSTTPSECPTIAAIYQAQEDGLDTILVAGHSGTLFDIMGEGNGDCAGLGLDISDNDRFPKKDDGKLANFGEVWKIVINKNGEARFVYRVELAPTKLSVVERTN